MLKLSEQDFKNITNYIYELCGIKLPPEKKYLLHQRLEPVMKEERCPSFAEFYRLLRTNPDSSLQHRLISEITTHETSFFRDEHLFKIFRESIMKDLVEKIRARKNKSIIRKGPKLSVLSAGSSTGQEPYSLSILIHEYLKNNFVNGVCFDDFAIKAVDISSETLSKAIKGEYTELEIKRGLSAHHVKTYFHSNGQGWMINNEIKQIVDFKPVNLIKPFAFLGAFDIIFCRNVLIYFENEIKYKVIDQLHKLLSDEGLLILGSSENLYTISDKFESLYYDNITIYKKK